MSLQEIKKDSRYHSIFEDISAYFEVGLETYISIVNQASESKKMIDVQECYDNKFVIEVRFYDCVRAASLDIYRYAVFHDIGYHNDTNSFSISESIYASYVIKWIASLHPLTFDSILDEQDIPPVSVSTLSDEELSKPNFIRNRLLYLCNEYFAVICASIILNPKDANEVTSITEAMDKEEEDVFIYSLRYRLKHQDSYTPLLKRIQSELQKIHN